MSALLDPVSADDLGTLSGPTVRVVRVSHIDAGGRPWVRYDGSTEPARPALVLAANVASRLCEGTRVACTMLEDGTPLLLGTVSDTIVAQTTATGSTSLQASVDDEHVVIEAKREIVLRCGRSSITLRRDGRIVLRGVDLLSRADRMNRIKGGAVHLN